MPVISSLILTNQNPVIAYTASVVTSGSIISNGLGNQLTSLQLTSSYANSSSYANTSSYAVTSSISIISQFDISSSYASQSFSSSYAGTSSYVQANNVNIIANGPGYVDVSTSYGMVYMDYQGNLTMSSKEYDFLTWTDVGGVFNVGDTADDFNGTVMAVEDVLSTGYISNTNHNVNFGINKTSPTHSLDVVGDGHFTGPITASGFYGTSSYVTTSSYSVTASYSTTASFLRVLNPTNGLWYTLGISGSTGYEQIIFTQP